ncbi:F0F1 ATP synthase subunit B [Ligilactobacillus cholophilus]|uniref:F0F1 ATP synthase subunit B n=1 Tax=Ligilactobacillus cholophilus TaxID=3050131 RepID=UPI0025B124B2|nr:F0F1 ATP synthase subunit B [Ligilactobacillus cholophilus]
MSTFLLGDAGIQWGDFLFYLVLFVIMVLIVKKFAWGPVTKILNERADKISNDIDSAEKARKEAEELAKKREDALNNSRTEAAGIISRAKQNGEQQKATIVDAAHEEVKTMKVNAKKDIEQEKQDALSSVKNDVAELSIEIASKIIQKELTPENQKELVDSYIEGLGKQNGNK